MKPSVYIETTIISYLTARPSRDLILAAQQRITMEWWQTQAGRFDLYSSELVAIECSAGDAAAAKERIHMLNQMNLLRTTQAATEVADALLRTGVIPAVASRDALHVGIAATNGSSYLLTWNCRHLAKATLRNDIMEICADQGWTAPTICTPEELFEEEST